MVEGAAVGTEQRRVTLLRLLLIGILPAVLNGWYNPLLASWPPTYWLADLIAYVLLPFIVVRSAIRSHLVTPDDLGFHLRIGGRRRPWLFALLVFTTPMALLLVDLLASRLAHELFPAARPLNSFNYEQILAPTAGWWRTLALLYLAASAGLVEEVYYRSQLLKLLSPGWGGGLAYAASSALLFASVHWEGGPVTLFRTACFGLVAAVIFRDMRNIWPLAVGHALVDLFWLTG
jgi:hypothetical protein